MLTRAGGLLASLGVISSAIGGVTGSVTVLLAGTLISTYVLLAWLLYSFRRSAFFDGSLSIKRLINAPVGATFTGTSVAVKIVVENGSGRRYDELIVEDMLPPGVSDTGCIFRISLGGRSRSVLEYSFTPVRGGSLLFPGVYAMHLHWSRLFFDRKVFPLTQKLMIFPSTETPATLAASRTFRTALRAMGRHSSTKLGSGSELAGIRGYAPGDAFRMIEWKATARTGSLMTKELEAESSIYVVFLLDTSASMMTGEPGLTSLDASSRLIAAASRIAVEDGNPVAMVTFSETVGRRLAPSSRQDHIVKILHTLAGALPLSRENVLRATQPRILLKTIHEYLRLSEWPTYRSRRVSVRGVLRHVQERLERGTPDLQSESDLSEALTRYVGESGLYPDSSIPLPFSKGEGMTQALLNGLSMVKERGLFLVFTDLDGMEESLNRILDTLRLVMSRLHRVHFILTGQFTSPGQSSAETSREGPGEVVERLTARAQATRTAIVHELERIGAPVTFITGEDAVLLVVDEILELKRGRRIPARRFPRARVA